MLKSVISIAPSVTFFKDHYVAFIIENISIKDSDSLRATLKLSYEPIFLIFILKD